MADFFTYATPESCGVSSKDITEFSRDLEHFGIYLHSFALLSGNRILAEGYRKPFTKDYLHRMYSSTKTFASMAVGILADEGKIDLDAPVLRYFPEYEKEEMYPYIREATVRDLLIMATPYSYGTTYSAHRKGYLEKNWTGSFFHTDTSHPSGTVFNYDTSATQVLGAIVERITGKPFLDLLRDRALREVGFSDNATVLKAPDGYSWSGSALFCTTLDLARLARLVMLDGKWNGKALLPEWYVKEAKTSHINNDISGFRSIVKGNGYGYQLWMTGDGTYSFLGMGNQLAVCMPEEDLLFVCTADSQGEDGFRMLLYAKLWEYIKRRHSPLPLCENKEAYRELQETLSSLEYPALCGREATKISEAIDGKTFIADENRMGITEFTFAFPMPGEGVFRYVKNGDKKEIRFGLGKALCGEFPAGSYFGEEVGVLAKTPSRCMTSGAWTDEKTLQLKCDLIDLYFGSMNMLFVFKGNEVGARFDTHAQWFLEDYGGFLAGHVTV